MASCVTVPVQTRFEETIGQEVIQTQVPFTSTLPPTFTTTTISTSICSTNTTSPISSTCTPTFVESVETIPGGTTVVTITSAITNPVTSTFTTTLFSTSCTSTPGQQISDPPSQPPPPTPTPTPTPTPPTSSTTSLVTSVINTTLPNGVVSTYTETHTSIGVAPTTQIDANNNPGNKTNLAPIVGGAVGGLVGFIALAMVAWYFFKKSHSPLDSVFNKTEGFEKNNRLGPLEDDNAHGYQYGLLGNEAGNAGNVGGNATGPSPIGVQEAGFHPGGNEVGFQPSGNEAGYQPGGHFNDVGYQPSGNEVGYQPSGNEMGYQPDPHHVRNQSVVPLLAGLGAGAAAGSSRPSSSGRPSTGGSSQALIPSSQQGYMGQGYGPNTYPPNAALAPGQMYGGPAQGYAPGGHYGSDPGHGYVSSGHSPNPSSASSSQWGGGSSPYSPPPQNMMPPIVTGSVGGASAYQQNFDPDNRSGSPVSIQEQRVLQVINPDTSYGYSSTSHGVGEAVVAGGSSGAAEAVPAPAVDGKGRPVGLGGQFVPLVHLDGGRYEEPATPAPTAGGALPPAYTNS